ncbi:MAG: MBL fold metallo-hydrolase, partial [Christensenellales bacterium]
MKVGQADASLILSEDGVVLIDVGEEYDGDEILNCLAEKGIEAIDCLIITHYDKDHIGGADKVLSGIAVKQVIQPDYQTTGKQYEQYLASLQKNNIQPVTLKEAMVFSLGDANYTLNSPEV